MEVAVCDSQTGDVGEIKLSSDHHLDFGGEGHDRSEFSHIDSRSSEM